MQLKTRTYVQDFVMCARLERQKQLSINSTQIFLNVCDCCFKTKKYATLFDQLQNPQLAVTVFFPSIVLQLSQTLHTHNLTYTTEKKVHQRRNALFFFLFFFSFSCYRSSMNRYVLQSEVVIVVSLLMSHVCIVIVYSTFSILSLLFTRNGSIFTCITLLQ